MLQVQYRQLTPPHSQSRTQTTGVQPTFPDGHTSRWALSTMEHTRQGVQLHFPSAQISHWAESAAVDRGATHLSRQANISLDHISLDPVDRGHKDTAGVQLNFPTGHFPPSGVSATRHRGATPISNQAQPGERGIHDIVFQKQ